VAGTMRVSSRAGAMTRCVRREMEWDFSPMVHARGISLPTHVGRRPVGDGDGSGGCDEMVGGMVRMGSVRVV
jgi:hypothetical protein